MRRVYDQFFKSLANEDPCGTLDMLGILSKDTGARISPLDRELVREPVLIDQGYLVEELDGEKWIAHIEAFSDIARSDVERVLWYATRLTTDTQLPVRSTILLMLEHCVPKGLTGKLAVQRGSLSIALDAEVVRFWEVPARRLLDSGHPKVLTWVPLTNGGPSEWEEAGRKLLNIDDAHLLEAFKVIGTLRYGKDVWQEFLEGGFQVITSDTLRKHSWLVQEWLEEGRVAGLEEGREEGRKQEARDLLTSLIEIRFPNLLPEFAALADTASADILHSTLRQLIAANTEEEARKILLDLKKP